MSQSLLLQITRANGDISWIHLARVCSIEYLQGLPLPDGSPNPSLEFFFDNSHQQEVFYREEVPPILAALQSLSVPVVLLVDDECREWNRDHFPVDRKIPNQRRVGLDE